MSPVALLGWYLFALFGPFSTAGSNLSIGLILIATAVVFPLFWRDVRRQPVFWLAVALTAYILARSLLALQVYPELDESHNPHWSDLLKVTGLAALPLGWWLYRYPRHVPAILATALAGLLTGAAFAGDWNQILAANFGSRVVWGYSPNYLGTVSGAASLGLLSWLVLGTKPGARRWAWFIGLPLLIITAFFLYTSQSREAWVALPIGLLTLFGAVLKYCHSRRRCSVALASLVGALAAIALAVFAFDGGVLLLKRMTNEWHTMVAALSGQLDAVVAAGGSTGLRVEMWLAGLEAATVKPLFGWGPGAGMIVLQGEFADMRFGHFHNLYIELLVSLGVVGLGLTAITIICFMRAARRASRLGLWPDALSVGVLAVTAFTAVTVLFAIRIGQTEGRASLTLLTALYGMAAFQVTNAKNRSLSAYKVERHAGA